MKWINFIKLEMQRGASKIFEEFAKVGCVFICVYSKQLFEYKLIENNCFFLKN